MTGSGNRVAVVDYGIGNVQSVVNACRRVGADPVRAASGADLLALDVRAIVLPGVGAIGEALGLIRERGIDEALERRVREAGIPFLGICVGMQVLAETCEEFGEYAGLGWVSGRVARLSAPGTDIRLPHIGWNTIEAARHESLATAVDGEHFYFCHSNVLVCDDAVVVACSEYGTGFVSAIQWENITGVQFHPEKSSTSGERLLAAFLEA